MSSKDLVEVTKELTGFKLQIVNNMKYDWITSTATGVKFNGFTNRVIKILINLREIRNSGKTHVLRRLGIKNIYLKVLLHEIAHIKQIRKYGNGCFILRYESKPEYYENMADRYARLNYKKVLSALDKSKRCVIL